MNPRISATLKSRKAWLTLLLLPLLVVLNRKLNLGLTPGDLALIAAGVVTWVLGEVHRDAKAIEANSSREASGKGGTE